MMKKSTLEWISPDDIAKNPENPRLIFRQEQMDNLLESMSTTGIKVPLTIYRDDKGRNILIDGERRWRCAKKLNLKKVPVIVHPAPTKLENILMMFHIHNVRVQWDPLAIALKLKEIQTNLEKDGKVVGVRELSVLTGIPVGGIRRYQDLLNLPTKFKNLLLAELEKPKNEQKISVDLIIEIQRSFKTIEKYVPEAVLEINYEKYIDVMVEKYSTGVINNVVKFRDISKIARAERAGQDRTVAITAIRDLLLTPKMTVEAAYAQSVKSAYDDRGLVTKTDSLLEKLEQLHEPITPTLRTSLVNLKTAIERLLRD